MISHKHKALFFHMPKCGGTSIEHVLGSCGFQKSPREAFYQNQHSVSLFDQAKKEYADHIDDYYKFCFVRNPWDRMVSVWKKHALPFSESGRFPNINDFNTFIRKYPLPQKNILWHARSQFFQLKNPSFYNFIGRYENIEEHLFFVLDSIGATNNISLPKLNQSSHNHYSNYYNEYSVKKVGEMYKEEIDYFGYQFIYQ
jgi:hypothetical protein